MKVYMFPGQGSQSKGMGGELFDKFPELTEKADQILGFSIKELCIDNPNRELNKTQFTQPALYVVNALSYYDKLESGDDKPDYVLGHSLGEFNALLAAEVFDFETGLRLVKKRGELMSEAKNGGMAAILNSNKAEITKLLKKNKLNDVDLANFNTLSQIVISGSIDDIGAAQSVFSFGEVTYHPLNTSGAFHSRYMKESQEQFETLLKTFKFSKSSIPVISNVTALPYKGKDVVKKLSSQMSSGVKWADSVQYIMKQAKEKDEELELVEVGNSDVLTNIVAKLITETKDVYDEVTVAAVEPVARKTAKAKAAVAEKPAEQPVEQAVDSKAEQRVTDWNKKYAEGTKVKSLTADYDDLETRTEAVVLFGHRAVVYMKGYNGYFDLEEIQAL